MLHTEKMYSKGVGAGRVRTCLIERVRTCLIGVLHCCNLTEAEVMKSMWPFESSSFSNSCGNIGNTPKEDMKHVRHCYIRSVKRKKSKKNRKIKKVRSPFNLEEREAKE